MDFQIQEVDIFLLKHLRKSAEFEMALTPLQV